MGGSSKPADPKVTPFVEPAAPSNPIPNYFGQAPAGAGMYNPDFGASKSPFGLTAEPAPIDMGGGQAPQAGFPSFPNTLPAAPPPASPQAMPQVPMEQQGFAPRGDMMPFSIPTRPRFGDNMPERQRPGGFDMLQRLQANPNMFTDALNQFRTNAEGMPGGQVPSSMMNQWNKPIQIDDRLRGFVTERLNNPGVPESVRQNIMAGWAPPRNPRGQ